ncbi:MAG: hypothetical protein KJ905_00225 [Nanoarchaeota archaeon]|nr:hypothetical protein [Nanoarchaeota archaeon]MBU1501186.1 hypothetical protein [Nanoarchaeota archaeon]MBU2459331.1 hypothetical protein [Nanoarchaeota archaeon]
MQGEYDLKAIVIPSGEGIEEDYERMDAASAYCLRNQVEVPFIISGVGPDISECLRDRLGRPKIDSAGKDFHLELYNRVRKEIGGIFGVDTLSLNSIDNMLNTFPEGTSGKYGMVSYPLHLQRLRMIEKRAKAMGKMAKAVEIVPIPTEQSFRQTLYGLAALVKTALVDLRKI